VINELFPRTEDVVATPMFKEQGERGTLKAAVINPMTQVVIATLLRAGDIPSGACFSRLVGVLNDGCVRQDFLGASRVTDAEHHVTGTAITYQKSSSLADRILLIPDPMGATGSTIVQVLYSYGREEVEKALAIATIHLIIAPEYIRRVTKAFPQVHIFTLRVDRGMSTPDVLTHTPGELLEQECGLTDKAYIVPGAGDMGMRLTGVA
jgi:uracil phosphoribosyltransferase